MPCAMSEPGGTMPFSKKIMIAVGLTFVPLLLASSPARGAPPDAREIVAAADRARNPQQAFRTTLTLVTYRGGQAREHVVLGLHAKPDAPASAPVAGGGHNADAGRP